MKPKNFPARKLKRRLDAIRTRSWPYTDDEHAMLDKARDIRTKKFRGAV